MKLTELLAQEVVVTSNNNVLSIMLYTSYNQNTPHANINECYKVIEITPGVYTNETLISQINEQFRNAKQYSSDFSRLVTGLTNSNLIKFYIKKDASLWVYADVYNTNYAIIPNAFCFVYHINGTHKIPLLSKLPYLTLGRTDPCYWYYCNTLWEIPCYDQFTIAAPFMNQTIQIQQNYNDFELQVTRENLSSNHIVLQVPQKVYTIDEFCETLSAIDYAFNVRHYNDYSQFIFRDVDNISSTFALFSNATVMSKRISMYFYNNKNTYGSMKFTDNTLGLFWIPSMSGVLYSSKVLNHCFLFNEAMKNIYNGSELISKNITLTPNGTRSNANNDVDITLTTDEDFMFIVHCFNAEDNVFTGERIHFTDHFPLKSAFHSFPILTENCINYIGDQHCWIHESATFKFLLNDYYVRSSVPCETYDFPLGETGSSSVSVSCNSEAGSNIGNLICNDSSMKQEQLYNGVYDMHYQISKFTFYEYDENNNYFYDFLGYHQEVYKSVYSRTSNLCYNTAFNLTSNNNQLIIGEETITIAEGNYRFYQFFIEQLAPVFAESYTIEDSCIIYHNVVNFSEDSSLFNYYWFKRYINISASGASEFRVVYKKYPAYDRFLKLYNLNLSGPAYTKLKYMVSIDSVIDPTVYELTFGHGFYSLRQIVNLLALIPEYHNTTGASSGFSTESTVFTDYIGIDNSVNDLSYTYFWKLFNSSNRIKIAFIACDNCLLNNMAFKTEFKLWPEGLPISQYFFKNTFTFDYHFGLQSLTSNNNLVEYSAEQGVMLPREFLIKHAPTNLDNLIYWTVATDKRKTGNDYICSFGFAKYYYYNDSTLTDYTETDQIEIYDFNVYLNGKQSMLATSNRNYKVNTFWPMISRTPAFNMSQMRDYYKYWLSVRTSATCGTQTTVFYDTTYDNFTITNTSGGNLYNNLNGLLASNTYNAFRNQWNITECINTSADSNTAVYAMINKSNPGEFNRYNITLFTGESYNVTLALNCKNNELELTNIFFIHPLYTRIITSNFNNDLGVYEIDEIPMHFGVTERNGVPILSSLQRIYNAFIENNDVEISDTIINYVEDNTLDLINNGIDGLQLGDSMKPHNTLSLMINKSGIPCFINDTHMTAMNNNSQRCHCNVRPFLLSGNNTSTTLTQFNTSSQITSGYTENYIDASYNGQNDLIIIPDNTYLIRLTGYIKIVSASVSGTVDESTTFENTLFTPEINLGSFTYKFNLPMNSNKSGVIFMPFDFFTKVYSINNTGAFINENCMLLMNPFTVYENTDVTKLLETISETATSSSVSIQYTSRTCISILADTDNGIIYRNKNSIGVQQFAINNISYFTFVVDGTVNFSNFNKVFCTGETNNDSFVLGNGFYKITWTLVCLEDIDDLGEIAVTFVDIETNTVNYSTDLFRKGRVITFEYCAYNVWNNYRKTISPNITVTGAPSNYEIPGTLFMENIFY